jgi:hypothetical protein
MIETQALPAVPHARNGFTFMLVHQETVRCQCYKEAKGAAPSNCLRQTMGIAGSSLFPDSQLAHRTDVFWNGLGAYPYYRVPALVELGKKPTATSLPWRRADLASKMLEESTWSTGNRSTAGDRGSPKAASSC